MAAGVRRSWVREIVRNKMPEQSWAFSFRCQRIMGYEMYLSLIKIKVAEAYNGNFMGS